MNQQGGWGWVIVADSGGERSVLVSAHETEGVAGVDGVVVATAGALADPVVGLVSIFW